MDEKVRQEHCANALATVRKVGLGVVATVNADDGSPHAAMVFIAADDQFNLYFLTKSETRKAKNLAKNDRVAVCVDDHAVLGLQMRGRAELLPPQEVPKVAEMLAESTALYPNVWPPISRVISGKYVVYRVHLDGCSVIDLAGARTGKGQSPITEIEVGQLSRVAAGDVAAGPEDASLSQSDCPRVMLIEQDTFISSMFKHQLIMAKYRVEVVSEGRQALDACRDFKPHLVIMETMLQNADGYALLNDLIRKYGTKVVVFSQSDIPEDVQSAYDIGASEYLVKFKTTPKEAVATVNRLLRGTV